MDELHLAEINNLYQKRTNSDSNATGMPIVPGNYYDYNHDMRNNKLIASIASFYEHIATGDDEKNVTVTRAMNDLMNNKDALDKYYYGGIISSDGARVVNMHTVKGSSDGQPSDVANAKFLPNYNVHTRMYGIPYVKGPYIEHDPGAQKS